MTFSRFFNRFKADQNGLYVSSSVSQYEKNAIDRSWPYTKHDDQKRLTDFKEVRSIVLDYFGIVESSAQTDHSNIHELLEEFSTLYGITNISLKPIEKDSLLGDSGLLLRCFSDGINVKRPPRWGISKLNEKADDIILLTHTLPPESTSLLLLFRRIFNRRYGFLLAILVVTFCAVFLSLIPTWLNAYIFNTIVPQGRSTLMIQIGFFLLMTKVISHTFKLFNQFMGIRLELILGYNASVQFFYRILHMASSFFDNFSPGDLQQRLGSLHQIRRVLQSSFISAITAAFVIVMNLLLIFFKSFSFELLIILVALSLIGPIIDLISAVIETIFRYQKLVLAASLNDSILEPLESIVTVRSVGSEDNTFDRYKSVRYQIARLEIKLGLIRAIINAMDSIIGAFIISMFLFAFSSESLLKVLDPSAKASAGVSQGYVILLLSAFTTINSATRSFSKSFLSLAEIYPDVLRLRPILRNTSLKSSKTAISTPLIRNLELSKESTGGTINSKALLAVPGKPTVFTGDPEISLQIMGFFSGKYNYSENFPHLYLYMNNRALSLADINSFSNNSCLLQGNSYIFESSIIGNLTDHSQLIDMPYLQKCLGCLNLESTDEFLAKSLLSIKQINPNFQVFSKRLMITRALYLKLSPVLVYGWLDDLNSEEISSIISVCSENNQILIAYSRKESVISKFSSNISTSQLYDLGLVSRSEL